MDAQKLLNKLEFEAKREWVRNRNEQPENETEQNQKRLHQLRARTAEIEEELKLRAQVEQEQERCFKAERELRTANMTLAERKAQEVETREFQIRLSRITSADQHPNWRLQENYNAECYREQRTPVRVTKP